MPYTYMTGKNKKTWKIVKMFKTHPDLNIVFEWKISFTDILKECFGLDLEWGKNYFPKFPEFPVLLETSNTKLTIAIVSIKSIRAIRRQRKCCSNCCRSSCSSSSSSRIKLGVYTKIYLTRKCDQDRFQVYKNFFYKHRSE